MSVESIAGKNVLCFHCGNTCRVNGITTDEKNFCCEGCKTVYIILNRQHLCTYYDLNSNPGINQRITVRPDKFSFLEDDKIRQRLIEFEDDKQVRLTFYLPQMHCSSCLYLLENLHRINPGIVSSKVNFTRKEVEIVFLKSSTTLRQVAETCTSVGYEPYISLHDLKDKRPAIDKTMVYQVGVAGFCFGNIMLMSFPEYLGIDISEKGLLQVFRWLNLLLALPVFFYSAIPFYKSSWSSIRHKFLNIDAPIALAIIITFIRSVYEVIAGSGSGYFDSMTGIVFFMLVGKLLQNKTYRQLSFDRDYTSYFPVAVTVIKDGKQVPASLPMIKTGDTLLIHNNELIPADGILTRGQAFIDYSFVTGESLPVLKEMGEMVYAGGKQTGGNIEVLTIKEVAQSYLTRLWNQDEKDNSRKSSGHSFVHALSRYFTLIVFSIALVTGIYWNAHDQARLWPAVTAVFIVACPCALLLSSTFTSGNILHILGRNQFYLKNATVIENIPRIDHIVFDKTGTLTETEGQMVTYHGTKLSHRDRQRVTALASSSTHPLSRALVQEPGGSTGVKVDSFKEVPGLGIEGMVDGVHVKVGSKQYAAPDDSVKVEGTNVFVSIDGVYRGYFNFHNSYRDQTVQLLSELSRRYKLSIISGDNENERRRLQSMFGDDVELRFNQTPEDKFNYIKKLQQQGYRVMMIGDGLNDGAALKQSDTGIAVSANTNNFTPASDAIIRADHLHLLPAFIRLCRADRNIIIASFILSLLYNVVGIYFSVQGVLSPMIAAILMPSSTISILLLTFGSSRIKARQLGL